MYLRHYVSANQRDWAKLLDVAQFSYNLLRSESTGRSPFEIVTGQQPITPNKVAIGYKGVSPAAYKFARSWEEQQEAARACLSKAAKRMKKWADKKRRPREFQDGDLVLVKLYQHGKGSAGQHRGLLRRYEGPFPVIKRVACSSHSWKTMKTPKEQSPLEHQQGFALQYSKEVEEIVSDRVVHHGHKAPTRELLVRWKGLPDSEASWEPLDDLWQFKDKIAAYEDSRAPRTSLDSVGENVAYRRFPNKSPQFFAPPKDRDNLPKGQANRVAT
ncbi:hypothetical protein GH714_036967 [Hevea brasiliensis]|uniref:Chromo domain-containing protein n=1 Tax=Hevea brasiliensis TaxID=3981 RepID=A0A6A6MRQ6_HEVBR|nr:hypothetical protein GH714_036967 [Hevea brasiliensis]